jgi:hypothetical protein
VRLQLAVGLGLTDLLVPSVLPQSVGLLPKWQLLVSVMAVFNTIQNFTTLKLTRRLYTGVKPESS